MTEWQPIDTAPKDRIIIGGSWEAEQGGFDWRFFESFWLSSGHFSGYPSHWVSADILPQAPEPPK